MKNCSYKKRIIAVSALMVVALLFVMFFSALFLSENLHHHCHCHDSECPVCEMIVQLDNTVRQLGSALVASLGIVCAVFALKETVLLFENSLIFSNPVSWKIRLNN